MRRPQRLHEVSSQGLEDGGLAIGIASSGARTSSYAAGPAGGDYHSRHEPIFMAGIKTRAALFCDNRTKASVFEVDRPMSSSDQTRTTNLSITNRQMVAS